MSTTTEHTIESNQDNFDPESMLRDPNESIQEPVEIENVASNQFSQVEIVYSAPLTPAQERQLIERREKQFAYRLHDKYEWSSPKLPSIEDFNTSTFIVNVLELDSRKDKMVITIDASDITVDMLKDFHDPKCSLRFNFMNKRLLSDHRVQSFVYSKEKHSVPSIELHLA